MVTLHEIFEFGGHNALGSIVTHLLVKKTLNTELLSAVADQTHIYETDDDVRDLPLAHWFFEWLKAGGTRMNLSETDLFTRKFLGEDIGRSSKQMSGAWLLGQICRELREWSLLFHRDVLSEVRQIIARSVPLTELPFVGVCAIIASELPPELICPSDDQSGDDEDITGPKHKTTELSTFAQELYLRTKLDPSTLTEEDIICVLQPAIQKAFCTVMDITRQIKYRITYKSTGDGIHLILSRFFGDIIARYVSSSTRERHRHGACTYLRPETFPDLTIDQLLLTLGRNTEIFTSGWKRLNAVHGDSAERWKILHAEVDALVSLVANKAAHDLLPRRAIEDIAAKKLELSERTDIPPEAIPMIRAWREAHPRVTYPADKVLSIPDETPIGVFVMELSDNGINYCSSQACPLCIKALKRWGISCQTYTTGNGELWKTEEVTHNPNLQAESLRSILNQERIEQTKKTKIEVQ